MISLKISRKIILFSMQIWCWKPKFKNWSKMASLWTWTKRSEWSKNHENIGFYCGCVVGATGDGHLSQQSAFWRRWEKNDFKFDGGFYFTGDAAFTLMPWSMTPFDRTQEFNKKHYIFNNCCWKGELNFKNVKIVHNKLNSKNVLLNNCLMNNLSGRSMSQRYNL